MHLRSLFAMLLLFSLANNALLPSLCAAHCAPPAANTRHYQRTSESDRETINQSSRDDSQDTACNSCTSEPNTGSIHASDCTSFMQTAALIEGSFAFDVPRTIAQLSIVQRCDHATAIVFARNCWGSLKPLRRSEMLAPLPFLSASRNPLAVGLCIRSLLQILAVEVRTFDFSRSASTYKSLPI